jgi:hypothetical protein
VSAVCPIRICASRTSVTGSLIRDPLTIVPFVEPRSSTTTPSPLGRKAT